LTRTIAPSKSWRRDENVAAELTTGFDAMIGNLVLDPGSSQRLLY
jgi:hypothetical protein